MKLMKNTLFLLSVVLCAGQSSSVWAVNPFSPAMLESKEQLLYAAAQHSKAIEHHAKLEPIRQFAQDNQCTEAFVRQLLAEKRSGILYKKSRTELEDIAFKTMGDYPFWFGDKAPDRDEMTQQLNPILQRYHSQKSSDQFIPVQVYGDKQDVPQRSLNCQSHLVTPQFSSRFVKSCLVRDECGARFLYAMYLRELALLQDQAGSGLTFKQMEKTDQLIKQYPELCFEMARHCALKFIAHQSGLFAASEQRTADAHYDLKTSDKILVSSYACRMIDFLNSALEVLPKSIDGSGN